MALRKGPWWMNAISQRLGMVICIVALTTRHGRVVTAFVTSLRQEFQLRPPPQPFITSRTIPVISPPKPWGTSTLMISHSTSETKVGKRQFSSSESASVSDAIVLPKKSREEQGGDLSVPLQASRLGLNPLENRFHAPIVYHERYSFDDWPPNHTFPMDKFERLAHALQTTCSKTVPPGVYSNLPRPIIRSPDDFFRPLDLDDVPFEDWFYSVIDKTFVTRFLEGQLTETEARTIGFREQTHRPELIERTVLEVAGTILTCQLALLYGIASNVAGGTHHAHPTGGAGYTILNDLAVAAHFLLTRYNNYQHDLETTTHQKAIRKILVVDCDVHQGDGTAKFSIPGLYTLSLHCSSNYPRPKAQSTYDVGIHDGCTDEEYLQILESSVNKAIDKVQPDFILYDAGVDIYEHDRLGRLDVTEDGIRKRDRWVLNRCVSAGIPVAAVVGGGYDKDVNALARRHAIVHEECAFIWRKYSMWKN